MVQRYFLLRRKNQVPQRRKDCNTGHAKQKHCRCINAPSKDRCYGNNGNNGSNQCDDCSNKSDDHLVFPLLDPGRGNRSLLLPLPSSLAGLGVNLVRFP